jgi:hypothetical protein
MMACCSSGPCCQEGLVYEQQKQQHISTLILFRGASLFCRMTVTPCERLDAHCNWLLPEHCHSRSVPVK